MKIRRLPAVFLLAMLLAASLACNAAALAPTPTPPPTATEPPSPTPNPGWVTLQPGLEMRSTSIPMGSGAVSATLVRVDPGLYTMRVHYDPVNPATISTWQIRTGAALFVNGGFFTPENTPLGLLVADSVPVGTSFDGFGGMLSVSDGLVTLRALSMQPYVPGEPLEQAVQSRPVLLYPGAEPADFNFPDEIDRRTAVALDTSGRLVFVIVDRGGVSLYTLRDWLATQTDFEVGAALNLDGGGSTGLTLVAGDEAYLVESWTTLPIVLAFYPIE